MRLIKIIIIILVSILFSKTFVLAQGDFCSTATNLGSLPTPGACIAGTQDGVPITVNGTTVGSTADNPYVYQTGCQGQGGVMDSPANDVWYSFVATGTVLNLSISGLSNANVGIWSGGCSTLGGYGCMTTPASGNGSMIVTQLNPGQTYYVSVSSSSNTGLNDGPFTLSIDNDIDCNSCLLNGAITSSPAPVNGGYVAGQVVTFCYTISGWSQQNTNWLHGVQISMGSGWTGAITATVPANTSPSGSGVWLWMPAGIGGGWGPGFYFDSGLGGPLDGNPANNFGDNCAGSACSWTFCFNLTVGPCTPGMDLGVSINTSGDGESGSWSSPACSGDAATSVFAIGICCPNPVMISSPVSCFGICDGSATADGAGMLNDGIGPWNYVWTDALSNVILTQNNVNGTSTATGLCAGTYNVSVTDVNNCVSTGSITVTSPPQIFPIAASTNSLCAGSPCTGTLAGSASGGTPGYTYSWSNGPNTQNQNGVCAGNYVLTVTDAANCTATANTTITAPPPLTATASGTNEICDAACDGTVSVVAGGGTPGYTYSWNNGAGNSSSASGLCDNTYTVTVTDANLCTATSTYTVLPGIIVTAGFTPPANQCLTGNSYTFTNTGSVGGGVTYNWSFGDAGTSTLASPSHTYAAAGTYTVTQTVTNGSCSDVATVNVTVYPMPIPVGNTTPVSCFGGNNGTANITGAAPGTGPFSYFWNPSGQTTNPATGLAAGSYTATVIDNYGCPGQITLVVTQPLALSATEVHVNPTCNGFSDGTATATGVNGTAGYTYSWSTIPVQNTPSATGLSAGSYTCTVTDNNGCITTVIATLTNPPGIVLNPSMIPANCGLPDGSSNVNVVSGGIGPFTYSWNTSPVQNTQTTVGVPAGTYIVTVVDLANGCIEDTTITVTSTAGITATTVLISDALCNGSSDGLAYAFPTGGAPVYTYSWNTSPIQTNDTLITGAGTYTVVITDGSGCTGNATITINEPTPIVASIPGNTPASCFGANDGTATAAGSGGTPGYTYSWNTIPVQNTQTATGLAPGSYTVTVTDNNGCTDNEVVSIIDGPLMTSSIIGTDVSCFGGNNGAANLTVNGGTAPYTYNWTPSGSISEDPTGLTAGWHNVIVTSQEGCTVLDSILINEPPLLVATIDSSFDVVCFGDNTGSAYASASGGTSPYSYSWNTLPVQATPSATSLPFGAYVITVIDANGCQSSTIANINQPPALVATTGSIDAYCGVDQGSVWAFPNNGVAPYTYTWDSATVIIGFGDTLSGLYPGSYHFLLEDANGCKFNQIVTVNAAPGGIASISSFTDALCFGSSDGTATVSIGGAFPGFTYQWDVAAGNQTTNPATGLAIGTYNVVVTDTFGCVMNTSVNIGEPTPLSILLAVDDKICPDSCNASISSTVSGGTLPYTYLWSDPNAQFNSSAINLCSGNFTVIVTDGNGCSLLDSATINNPPKMIINHTVIPANCGQPDGSASAVVTANGIAPFTFSWSDGFSVVATGSSMLNVIAGTYFVTVTDSLGCSVIDSVTIPNQSGPTIAIDSIFNVLCSGGNNGYGEVQVTGGVFPYTYSWNTVPIQTTPSASNLTAGFYNVTATDSNGCTVSTAVIITEPSPLVLSSGGVDPTCFSYNDGSVWVNSSGGVQPYTYSWNTSPVQNNDTAFALISGSYTATVIDSNGCFNTATVSLTNPLLFSVIVTGNNVTCNNACDGSAIATLTNGISPFVYAWDDPSTQTTDSIFGLCDTTVNVIITDGMGCIANGSIIITQPALLVLTENNHGNVSCTNGNNGFSSVNVVGGTGPYTYIWDLSGNTVSTNQAANNLIVGNYLVTVTDANGCTDQITVVITEPNPLVVNASSTDVDCYGASTGSAYVSVFGGTNPYTYQWNDLALQITDTAFNLVANASPGYSITVTDSLGCTFTINNIIINQPTQLILNTSTVSSTCGSNNGSATVAVGGGTPSYSYNWNTIPAQGTPTASNIVAGNYVIIVTDANGCVDSATANVTDLGGPTVTIPTTTNVSCNGANDGTAQSNVVGGATPYSYSWNTIPIQTTPNAINLAGQTYSVTVIDNNGCIASASTIIGENSSLSASINASTNVSCFGLNDGAASVIAAGGTGGTYTYSWNTIPVQSTSGATGLISGTYIVTVSDSNLCTASDTVIITQPSILSVTLDSLSDVTCNGGNDGYINITAAGGTLGYSYSWNPNISNGPTAAGLIAGSYDIIVTDNNGCTASGNYLVGEPAQLAFNISSTPSSCGALNATATVNIVTNSTPGYTYNWNTSPIQTTPTATGLAASNYSVTVTDANGCQLAQNVILTNLPGPIVDSVITTPVSCNSYSDGTATVYASGNAPLFYSWNTVPPQTNQQALNLSASPPLYTVTVTDVNGCPTVSVAQITEPNPLSTIINSPDTVCYGEYLQLFANASGGNTPYSNFNWTGGVTQSGQGPIIDTLTSSTTYNVIVVDGNGCTAFAQKTVIVRAPLNLTATNDVICQGQTATLNASGSGGILNNLIYNWFVIDSLNLSTSTTGVMNPVNPLTVSPSSTTNYIVTVEDGCSLPFTVGATVIVNDTATGQLVPVRDTCQGFVQYFALTSNPSIGVTYEWDFDSDGIVDQSTSTTTTSYVYPSAGTYDLTVYLTTAQGCPSVITEPNWVTVNPNPIADFTTNPSMVTILNPTYNFVDQSFDADTWYWTFGNYNSSIIQNPSHTYLDTGYYDVTLLVTNVPFGCTDTITKTVRVRPDFFFAIPNTFTPDGDGLNETFFPGALVGATDRGYDFYIFDRWGELIFEGHNLRDGWDGTYKGKIVMNDVYVWKIEVFDFEGTGHNYIGHVNVLK